MLTLTTAQMLRVRVRREQYHLIRPRLLTDGRLGVSEQVLLDPAHAGCREVLLSGELSANPPAFTAMHGEHGTFDGKIVRIAADDHEWSLAPTAAGHRFELRTGDIGLPDDGQTQQRAELAGVYDTFGSGEEVWSSWTTEINIADGFKQVVEGSPNWGLIVQWHSIDGTAGRSPVLAFDYGNNAFRVITRSDGEMQGGNGVEKVRFAGALPVGPVSYVCRCIFGQAGQLQVWRNGAEIVSFAGPVGYFNDAGDLAYLQWGIYRRENELPAAVTTSNMRWGLTNLRSKIASPDPV